MFYQARTYLELQIGQTHTIEIIIHLRCNDLNWWNSNALSHEKQLFKIIKRQILPIECSDYIDYHHFSATNTSVGSNVSAPMTTKNNSYNGRSRGRDNIIIGDRNKRSNKSKSNNNKQQSRKKQRKESNGNNNTATTAAKQSSNTSSTTSKNTLQHDYNTDANTNIKNKKEDINKITFLFGETIQMTCKMNVKSCGN